MAEVQTWKINTNDLISKQLERMAYLRAALVETYEEIDVAIEEVNDARTRLNLLLRNVLMKHVDDFDELTHCAVLKEDHVNVYLLEDLTTSITEAVEKEELPESVASVKVNEKQQKRLLDAIKNYEVKHNDFLLTRKEIDEIRYVYGTVAEDVLDTITDPELASVLYDDAEIYDPDKHSLFIRRERGVWSLEYVRWDDAEVLAEQLEAEKKYTML